MKFAHLADIHLGGFREQRLRDANQKAFMKAIDTCIEEKVDFVLIAGDLFNTSLPSFESLKDAVAKLKELRDNDIPIYIIAGSHDFSPSGKTMLDVLENTGLFRNVVKGKVKEGKLNLKFTIDQKTGAKITGMLGRKGMLEKNFYNSIDREGLEKEDGYKIFMFHTALTELKPKEFEAMDSSPISLLPKGFNYYAGGHPHIVVERKEEGYGTITYPGPLFPNNFAELEKLHHGGFYIVEDDKTRWIPVKMFDTLHLVFDCNDKSAEEVEEDIKAEIKKHNFENKIITMRLFGVLSSGKSSDINFKDIFNDLYAKRAYFVMKNTNKLQTREFEEVQISEDSVEDIERTLISEHVGQIEIEDLTDTDQIKIISNLMHILDTDRNEGEKVTDFEKRINSQLSDLLNL